MNYVMSPRHMKQHIKSSNENETIFLLNKNKKEGIIRISGRLTQRSKQNGQQSNTIGK